MSKVVYLLQNPNAPDTMYALWDTGRIDPHGGALPIFDAPDWFNTPYQPAIALHITDWAGPSGYVLDVFGGFQPFGSAPDVGTAEYPWIMSGVPYVGGISGVQVSGPAKYVDWSWNDDGSGQGYVLDYYGQLYHFGGALAAPRSGPLWGFPDAKHFKMQWSPFKRSVLFDKYGGRNFDFPYLNQTIGSIDGYYDTSRDWGRDVVVTDWGTSSGSVVPSGYLMTASGTVYSWGPLAPPDVSGEPFVGNAGSQVGLALTRELDPLTLAEVSAGGNLVPWVSSTPPSVVAGGAFGIPADPTTNTTRPSLAWSYSDPQSDSQAAWQVLVFEQAVVVANSVGLNPNFWRSLAVVDREGTDSTLRGIVSPVDLDNGPYRLYVRAQDTSGKWSSWSNRAWTQSVPVPPTPTNLFATIDGFQTNLRLTVSIAEADQLIVFEASDDAGLTWTPVRGAEAVPAALATYAVDYDVPLGAPRTYRARVYYATPRSISLPSVERTVTVERYTFVLTSVEDPSLGGEVFPSGSMGWDREVVAGVYEPLGAEYPIVITDGTPRRRRRTLTLESESVESWALISGLIEKGHTLLLREPFGDTGYYRVVGRFGREQIRAIAASSSPEPLAHIHEVKLPLVEVARPEALPAETT